MMLNVRAVYKLAQYLEAVGHDVSMSPKDRKLICDMFIPCIEDTFNMKELLVAFTHAEKFFKYDYGFDLNDYNMAKFLRYLAKHEKFPKLRSLKPAHLHWQYNPYPRFIS